VRRSPLDRLGLRRRKRPAVCELPDWARRRAVAETSFVPWTNRVAALEGRTVLEYGCGNGAIAAAFAPRAGKYVGLDIDEAAVREGGMLLSQQGIDAELRAVPVTEIMGEVASMRGEIDLFLCYAVLEHMTIGERLELLDLARQVVRPNGAIVVVETPNRLLPWDHHTSQLPFYSQLPDDLAIRYRHRSPRTEFVSALDAAAQEGEDRLREVFTRWGRGMSYHEFELVFHDLPARTLATSWEPELLEERNIHREELALQAVLDEINPTLPPSFSRYWLDLVIAATPVSAIPPHLYPWPMSTVNSPACELDHRGVVRMHDAAAALSIELPGPTSRLVVGAETGGDSVDMVVIQADTGQKVVVNARRGSTGTGYAEARFQAASQRYELRLGSLGVVTFVGYER
jgi:SAM-dependent methyltransferase